MSAQSTVCLGDGLDASVDGLLATVVFSVASGVFIWLSFAILRPRFRQIYGLREWFSPEGTRPKPLKNTLWAFLFPPVPLSPSIFKDISDSGKSAAKDALLFPSDEQLAQRTISHCFFIVLGWSVLGLAAAIPIYVVSLPCISKSASNPVFGGMYSTIQDLSLLRLLKLVQNTTVSTSSNTRTIVEGIDYTPRARVRIIILTVILIVLGVLPAVWMLCREFTNLINFRRQWTDIHLQGIEIGWLCAQDAPGFVGWGERRVKEFIHKTGLGSSLLSSQTTSNPGNGSSRRRRESERHQSVQSEDGFPEIDVQSVFSIGDTSRLSVLIEERDIILEQLEMAESKYINSFRITTPEPSIAEPQPPEVPDNTEGISHISRPRALRNPHETRRKRSRNPANGSSSYYNTYFAPTSYVAPSQYYKVGVPGVNGGSSFGTSPRQMSFSESINQRVTGTRFQEINRSRSLLGFPLPIGSRLRMDGQRFTALEPTEPIPDPTRYGPNFIDNTQSTGGLPGATYYGLPISAGQSQPKPTDTETSDPTVIDSEWVDVMHEAPIDFSRPSPPITPSELLPGPDNTVKPHQDSRMSSSTFRFGRRPKIFGPTVSLQRDSIPLRPTPVGAEAPPPHLRLQRAPPFVRPLTGFDHDILGQIYADIRTWRTRLKAINQEISEGQSDAYADIADGARIRGWVFVGRGLRFLPSVQLIEGRSKDDIRWDLLQITPLERKIRWTFYWFGVIVCGILLAIGLTAAVGLALAPAPNYAHYITFLAPLANNRSLTSGLATVLAPSVAVLVFVALAFGAFEVISRSVATVSASAGEILIVKTLFYLILIVVVVWFVAAGAILYAFGSLSMGHNAAQTIADGSVYISLLVLAFIINLALIAPGLLMLQPRHLRRVINGEKFSATPRQRFRALYPRSYNPIFALPCSMLAFAYASSFSLIFPLIGPAACLVLLLSLIAHRYLVAYVYGRTRSQTGGLLQIWLTKRFATLIALQPVLMGLELLSRKLWPEGGVLIGVGVATVLIVETYAYLATRGPKIDVLHPVTREALGTFGRGARPQRKGISDDDDISAESSHRHARTRGSFASVLDMMSETLAVHPSSHQARGPVPMQTETLDDLVATERAARTHPDAPPRLPPLPFADHAEEVSQILYAPELVAPPPIIWLPNDTAGVARSEAFDLERYHGLRAVLDVRSVADARLRRRSSGR